MKAEDRYLRYVRWITEDSLYVDYCPDLFFGGVCHSTDEEEAYKILVELVREEVADLIAASNRLPPPMPRPMRELEPEPEPAPVEAVAA